MGTNVDRTAEMPVACPECGHDLGPNAVLGGNNRCPYCGLVTPGADRTKPHPNGMHWEDIAPLAPKRISRREKCRKCGKPTKYGPNHPLLLRMNPDGVYHRIGVLCAACLKIEGPKALASLNAQGLGSDIIDPINQSAKAAGIHAETDRTTEPTMNNATGWTDDPNGEEIWAVQDADRTTPKPSPTPCSPPVSSETTPCPFQLSSTNPKHHGERCTKPSGHGGGHHFPSDDDPASLDADSRIVTQGPPPKLGQPCPHCDRPMTPTETGFRCEPCTDRLSATEAQCVGCDYNDAGRCTMADDDRCPITYPPITGPQSPRTEAELTRLRAGAELAARHMLEACDACGERKWNWRHANRRNRVGVLLTCACGATEHHYLSRDGLYALAVAHRLVVVRRDPHRAFYQLDRIEAVAVCENPDHDVVTFRAGGETQCFAVYDAEDLIAAIAVAWGMKP